MVEILSKLPKLGGKGRSTIGDLGTEVVEFLSTYFMDDPYRHGYLRKVKSYLKLCKFGPGRALNRLVELRDLQTVRHLQSVNFTVFQTREPAFNVRH